MKANGVYEFQGIIRKYLSRCSQVYFKANADGSGNGHYLFRYSTSWYISTVLDSREAPEMKAKVGDIHMEVDESDPEREVKENWQKWRIIQSSGALVQSDMKGIFSFYFL